MTAWHVLTGLLPGLGLFPATLLSQQMVCNIELESLPYLLFLKEFYVPTFFFNNIKKHIHQC